jgi:hypothetical protein
MFQALIGELVVWHHKHKAKTNQRNKPPPRQTYTEHGALSRETGHPIIQDYFGCIYILSVPYYKIIYK